MFKPAYNYIEIEPFKVDKVIFQEKDSLVESGRILRIGESCMNYSYKVGDILYFQGYGCIQSEPDLEGNRHWVVMMDRNVILGAYEQ